MGKRVSDRAMIAALEQFRGLIVPAALALGVDASTVRRRAKNVPAVGAALQESRDLLVDSAEAKLAEAIDAGEAWAVSLTVRQLGRSRGWGDAVALTGAGGGPLALAHQTDDPKQTIARRLEEIRARLLANNPENAHMSLAEQLAVGDDE